MLRAFQTVVLGISSDILISEGSHLKWICQTVNARRIHKIQISASNDRPQQNAWRSAADGSQERGEPEGQNGERQRDPWGAKGWADVPGGTALPPTIPHSFQGPPGGCWGRRRDANGGSIGTSHFLSVLCVPSTGLSILRFLNYMAKCFTFVVNTGL